MSMLLRIKLKTLAFQAKEFWTEEQIALHHARNGSSDAYHAREFLHNMRVGKLRKEARAANLAYGFFRGRDYWQMELTCNERPNFERVKELVMKFGWENQHFLDQKINQWIRQATEYLEHSVPKSENHIQISDTPHIAVMAIEVPFMPAFQNESGFAQILKGFINAA